MAASTSSGANTNNPLAAVCLRSHLALKALIYSMNIVGRILKRLIIMKNIFSFLCESSFSIIYRAVSFGVALREFIINLSPPSKVDGPPCELG